jgi:hypothetical protein
LKEQRNEALRASTGPLQPDAENTSADHAQGIEEIRLRAYEIHLERGGFPGNELDDWLQPNANSKVRRSQKHSNLRSQVRLNETSRRH